MTTKSILAHTLLHTKEENTGIGWISRQSYNMYCPSFITETLKARCVRIILYEDNV
jgi:hypothetical protein